MKIIKRIAEQEYCYTEIHFESLEEYKTEYPKFAQIMSEVKQRCKNAVEPPPFDHTIEKP